MIEDKEISAVRSANSFEYSIEIRFEMIILQLLKTNNNTIFLFNSKQPKMFPFQKFAKIFRDTEKTKIFKFFNQRNQNF